MIDFYIASLHGFVRNQEKVSQAYETSVSKKPVHTKRTTLHFFVRNGERFPLFLETNNAFRIFTQTYFNSKHTIDLCVVKVFMVLLETIKKFLKLTKRPWVRHNYIPNEQHFILLLGTNNALRIFMVLSETKSALVIKNFSTLLPIYSLKFRSL